MSIISKFNKSVNTKLGSSLALPANGLGGSRATSLLVAHFALQNTASNSAEKIRPPKSFGGEAQAGGQKRKGVGGKEFLPACFRSRSV